MTRCDARHIVHGVEVVTKEKRRRNKWRTFRTLPCDMRIGHISLAARPHRECGAGATRAAVNQTVTDNRHRNRLRHISSTGPQQLAGAGIVSIDRAAAADNYLDSIS